MLLEDGTFTYQDVKLLNFNVSNESVKKSFNDIINDLTESVTKDFRISKIILFLKVLISLIVSDGQKITPICQHSEKMR